MDGKEDDGGRGFTGGNFHEEDDDVVGDDFFLSSSFLFLFVLSNATWDFSSEFDGEEDDGGRGFTDGNFHEEDDDDDVGDDSFFLSSSFLFSFVSSKVVSTIVSTRFVLIRSFHPNHREPLIVLLLLFVLCHSSLKFDLVSFCFAAAGTTMSWDFSSEFDDEEDDGKIGFMDGNFHEEDEEDDDDDGDGSF